jgi:hypothetical protein
MKMRRNTTALLLRLALRPVISFRTMWYDIGVMKARQTAIIWTGTLLVVGMALYPPWACVGRQGIGPAAGYHWFFAPPEGPCVVVNLDFPRLLIQWVVVGLLAAVSYLAWPPPTFFTSISRILARIFRVLITSFRLILTAAPPLILVGVCLGLLYMGCMALQPWVESVWPPAAPVVAPAVASKPPTAESPVAATPNTPAQPADGHTDAPKSQYDLTLTPEDKAALGVSPKPLPSGPKSKYNLTLTPEDKAALGVSPKPLPSGPKSKYNLTLTPEQKAQFVSAHPRTHANNSPWLFMYVLLVAAFASLFIAALFNEMKEIPGHLVRRCILGLFALVKGPTR